MTDKVQKIREEVVRLHNLLPVMDGDNISVNYADRICTTLEMYIDSMQGEQVDYGKLKTSLDDALSKETKESWEKFLQEEEKTSVWHDASEEPKSDKDIAVVNREGCMWSRYMLEDLCIEWKHFVNDVEIDKWAYVEDLLKL